MLKNKFFSFVLFLVITYSASFIGGLVTISLKEPWYSQLIKSNYNPPDWVFAPVWTTLYLMMTLAIWFFWNSKNRDMKTVYIYFIHIVFNTTWSIVFFGLHQILLALAVLMILIFLIVILIIRFKRVNSVSYYPYDSLFTLVLLCLIPQYKFTYFKLMDDVVIIGGGIIGTATAYFLSKEGRKVKVIERDPTYKTASFPLSLGGFRRQFFQTENILLGKFAREFIFQIPDLLKTEKNPKPTASMVTNGYLLMFGPEHAEEQYKALENHKACEAGTKNIKGSELPKFFPYINSNGIETATFTDNQSEGWIDPFMFHGALKSKAMELGAEFIKGEVKTLSEIKAKTIISAAGCWTKELLEDIPVEPQKHTVFRVKCPKHIPEMPLTGDLTTGVYWRPEGKEYLAGSPKSVFEAKDLEPAWDDFEELVWPALAQRIPAFEELKLTGGWAGYYDCNRLDNNAVVGKHPKFDNVYLATGFTGRGLMQAPGIGRALTELITTGSYQSIDISNMAVERVLGKKARPEPYVL